MADRLRAKLASTYRLERELGGGGMSRLFVAEDLRLKRRVVIKVLPPEMAPPANAERFQREIELAAGLQHPHIVPLLATDSVDGMLYYTMPFVTGEPLSERLARQGALPLQDALRIWRAVLDALAHAHASGVVHRDIKPGNILLSGRHALVTDFGISRAIETVVGEAWTTTSGLVIGTPAYMAPEVAAGEPGADHRADLYAAGLVMYEMLAGRPPFVAGSAREYLLAHRLREPPPLVEPAAPPKLLELVLRCLAKDPAERPQSADAILAELDIGATGEVRSTTTTSTTTQSRAPRLRRVAPYAIVTFALVAVVFTAIRPRHESPGTPGATVEPPAIAVLPWTYGSADPDDAALADGMTRELTAILGRSADLRVIAGTPLSALQGRHMDVHQLADSLQVSHVLEGGLQKAGSRLHVQVRLVDARDGSTPWSQTYDREFADVLDVREDIARAVTSALAVPRPGGERAGPSPRRHTPSIAAHEWYLRGMDVSLLRNDSVRRQGVAYFERAISIDSTYVDAHAGLALMYAWLANGAGGARRVEWLERARQAALTAVALDDENANARTALGWVRLVSKEYYAAEAELELAITLDPRVPRGYEGLARAYMMTGRPAEQLAAARLGMETDPFSHSAVRELALALATNGRCEESLDQLLPLKTLSPPAGVAGLIRGQCYASRQMWQEAIAEFRWAVGKSTAGLAFLGYALARAGRQDEAASILSDLMAGREYSHGSWGIAVVYAGMRDYDEAFAWLEKAVDDGTMHSYMMHPVFADLHRDPRFDRLKERMGVQQR